jgi:chemotaxis protein CheD
VSLRVVGISDCVVSGTQGDVLVTHSLGSCVAVAIHDPIVRVGGLLHFLLPTSTLDPRRAAAEPFVYADTGIPELFHRAYLLSAEKKRMRVCVAGGAQVTNGAGAFNIGKRNLLACRKILWGAGVTIDGEESGGETSRTVRLDVSTGLVTLSTSVGEIHELRTRKGAQEWHITS